MRASQHNTLQQISVKIDIINFGSYYKPTAVVELLNLLHADNQATHLESSWEYKLDRYTRLPNHVLLLYAKFMQTFSIVQSGWQFSKKGGAGDNLNRVRLYFINYLLFHT